MFLDGRCVTCGAREVAAITIDHPPTFMCRAVGYHQLDLNIHIVPHDGSADSYQITSLVEDDNFPHSRALPSCSFASEKTVYVTFNTTGGATVQCRNANITLTQQNIKIGRYILILES